MEPSRLALQCRHSRERGALLTAELVIHFQFLRKIKMDSRVRGDDGDRLGAKPYSCPPRYFFSPAVTRVLKRFCAVGSGQVAYGVNAHGGL